MRKSNLRLFLFSFFIMAFFLYLNIHSAAYAFEAKPIFEVDIGSSISDAGPKLGLWVEENRMTVYDKFYFPASFAAYKNLDLVLVLDSIRNRICQYSLTGNYLGEIKLPFNYHPIDFAYFPESRTMIIAFQGTPNIGILELNKYDTLIIDEHHEFNIAKILGFEETDTLAQHVWPCNIGNASVNVFVLNFCLAPVQHAVFSYKYGDLKYIKDVKLYMTPPIGSSRGLEIMGIDRKQENIKIYNIKNGSLAKIRLPNEFAITDEPSLLPSIELVGTDMEDNLYIKARLGEKDVVKNTYIYKIKRSGVNVCRYEVPNWCLMISNRYIFIDPDGNIFYMQKDPLRKTIKFYQF